MPRVVSLHARRHLPPAQPEQWSTSNRAQLLVDVPSVLGQLLPAIRGAREVVDVALFSLLPDGPGDQLAAALAQKAREGVEVNVVLDRLGSLQIPGTPWWELARKLKDAGVNVRFATRFVGRTAAERHTDHRKLVVVDGRTAFVGGMNFSAAYADWHDVMAKVSGPAAAQAGRLFLDHWGHMGGPASARHRAVIARSEAAHRDAGAGAKAVGRQGSAAVLTNAPDHKDFALTRGYLHRIRTAKRRLWVTTPFIGDRDVVRALADAARRGVDVRVLTSGKALLGVELIPLFTRSFYEELEQAGVKVRELPQPVHAKTLVADDEAIVSSLNLTRRAAYHDHEIGMATRDPQFVGDLAKLYAGNFRRALDLQPHHFSGLAQRAVSAVVNGLRIQY